MQPMNTVAPSLPFAPAVRPGETPAPHIDVFPHPDLGPSVNARDLYPLLVNSQASRDIFTDWFLDVRARTGIEPGVDYVEASRVNSQTNRSLRDYIVSVPAAIRIAGIALKARATAMVPYLEKRLATYGQAPDSMPVVENNSQSTTPVGLPFGPNGPVLVESERPAPIAPPVPFETTAQRLRRELKEAEEEEARQVAAAAQAPPVDYLQRLKIAEQQLAAYGGKVDALLLFFQQSAAILKGVDPANIEPLSTRTRLVRLVDGYAAKTQTDHQSIWRYLYGQLTARCQFDVYAHSLGKKDPNYLDVVEENGQIESLYTLAKAALVAMPTK